MAENRPDEGEYPTWGSLVDALADALATHRADMHETSNRPCDTCAKSARVLAAYEQKRGRRAVA